jgi:protein ImuB
VERHLCAKSVEAGPFALIEKSQSALRLVAINAEAQQQGLQQGMTVTQARARVPELAVAPADVHADAKLLTHLAATCERFTPLVACDGMDGLMLDVTGCAHLFGGEMALHDRVCMQMECKGLTTRAVIAGTPDAAHVLGRYGKAPIIVSGGEEKAVSHLPVSALECSADISTALTRAGLKTIGALAARPSQLLVARFGAALTSKLNRVLGRENIRITPLRPAPALVVENHFAEPLLDMAQLCRALESLCIEICVDLEKQAMGGRAFEITIFRSDGAIRRVNIETSQPLRDAKSLFRLISLRINTLEDPLDPGFGFDALRLAVLRHEKLGQQQRQLDGKIEDATAVDALVDRLAARFGRHNVIRFVSRDSHDPLREAVMLPAMEVSTSTWPTVEKGEAPSRPLHLFNPAQPIEAMAQVPDGPPRRFRWRKVLHEVTTAEGPERIAPEWWRDTTQTSRDYYNVEDVQGRRFWIYREGHFGEGDRAPRWFVHGLFA